MSVTQEAPTVVGKDSTRTSAPVLGGIDQRAIATYTKPGDLGRANTSPTPALRARPATARWSAATLAMAQASSTPRGATWSPWCSPPRHAGRRSTAGSPPGLDRASPKPTTSTRPIRPTWHTSGSPGFSTMRTILAGCACLLRPDGAGGQFRRVQGYAQLSQLAGALAQATASCSQPIPQFVSA